MTKENTLSDKEVLKCQLDADLSSAVEGSKQIITSGYQFGQDNTKFLCGTKKGCQWKDLKAPPELETKNNYVKLQNNFNCYSHFQDHSNAHEIFHLGTQALYFYSHITWLQNKLLYPFITLIYHHPWKKENTYSRHKDFFFFFLRMIIHSVTCQKFSNFIIISIKKNSPIWKTQHTM